MVRIWIDKKVPRPDGRVDVLFSTFGNDGYATMKYAWVTVSNDEELDNAFRRIAAQWAVEGTTQKI